MGGTTLDIRHDTTWSPGRRVCALLLGAALVESALLLPLAFGGAPESKSSSGHETAREQAAAGSSRAFSLPSTISVRIEGPEAKQERTHFRFQRPVDFRRRRLDVTVQVPADFIRRPYSAVQLWAKDGNYRWQNTTWSEGSLSPENPNFDMRSRILTLSYTPTSARVNQQGWSEVGFDPAAGIREVGIKVGTPSAAGASYRLHGTVRVLRAVLTKLKGETLRGLDSAGAIMTSVLRRSAGRAEGPPAPISPAAVKTGVSRFFRYGDLHRWPEVRAEVAEVFKAQQRAGLTGFRLMGGLDTRRANGGVRFGRREMEAMAQYLVLAEAAGQRDHIFTLFDAAIPNDALTQAMVHPSAKRALLSALRPFVRRFGTATIDGRRVIFDLVNEIHALSGVTERQRQRFVEALVKVFIEEAPGATLALGLRGPRELAYWLYLPKRFAGQPVTFLFTFHCYGKAINRLPPVWTLNLPEGVEVGITEADTRQGIDVQLRTAAAKGYTWLLFWHDADHPYDPVIHRAALGARYRIPLIPLVGPYGRFKWRR